MAYVEAVVARWGFDAAPEGPFGVTLLEGCWGLMCAKRQWNSESSPNGFSGTMATQSSLGLYW